MHLRACVENPFMSLGTPSLVVHPKMRRRFEPAGKLFSWKRCWSPAGLDSLLVLDPVITPLLCGVMKSLGVNTDWCWSLRCEWPRRGQTNHRVGAVTELAQLAAWCCCWQPRVARIPSVLNFNRSYLRILCVGKVHLLRCGGRVFVGKLSSSEHLRFIVQQC